MILFSIALLLLIIKGVNINENSDNPLSIQTTEVLKGIGILIVFVDHISGYLRNADAIFLFSLDSQILQIYNLITKFFVGLFLFFSGYGVTFSILSKGQGYVDAIPRKRIYTTLVNFDIAVVAFLCLNFFLGTRYDLFHVLLSFVAWESLGNSNWYIFAILCCYLSSYLVAKLDVSNKYHVLGIGVLSLCYMTIISYFKELWWYNCIFAYVGGGIFCIYKTRILQIVKDRYFMFVLFFSVILAILLPLSHNPIVSNVAVLCFCFLIVLFCLKIQVNEKFLGWCGRHLFPLYIYQRIPMILGISLCPTIARDTPFVYILLCLLVSIIIAKIVPQIKFER